MRKNDWDEIGILEPNPLPSWIRYIVRAPDTPGAQPTDVSHHETYEGAQDAAVRLVNRRPDLSYADTHIVDRDGRWVSR